MKLLLMLLPIAANAREIIDTVLTALRVPLFFLGAIIIAFLVVFVIKKFFKIGKVTKPFVVFVMFILILLMNIGFMIEDAFSYTEFEVKSLVGLLFPSALAYVFYRLHLKSLSEDNQ